MKQSQKVSNPTEDVKPRISKQLYVQVEEHLNLRRAILKRQDLMTLQTMARKTLGREGKNNGS